MPERDRLSPGDRTEQILRAAVEAAKTIGYDKLTRDVVAAKAGCSIGLVSLRFKTMPQLRRAVMRRAIADGVLPVIAQGIVAKDVHALKAPEKLRRQAIATLV